uniref:Uncharacterized protein MANES_13G124400 n=1 Tax=Rhizophora mucronata TaxID=61149 RepID=A0A2P2JDT7_RHIMU
MKKLILDSLLPPSTDFLCLVIQIFIKRTKKKSGKGGISEIPHH